MNNNKCIIFIFLNQVQHLFYPLIDSFFLKLLFFSIQIQFHYEQCQINQELLEQDLTKQQDHLIELHH
jgi:hypothetical protein